MRQNLLMAIFISGLVVGANMRISDNLFHFLEYLASLTHDGVKVLLLFGLDILNMGHTLVHILL